MRPWSLLAVLPHPEDFVVGERQEVGFSVVIQFGSLLRGKGFRANTSFWSDVDSHRMPVHVYLDCICPSVHRQAHRLRRNEQREQVLDEMNIWGEDVMLLDRREMLLSDIRSRSRRRWVKPTSSERVPGLIFWKMLGVIWNYRGVVILTNFILNEGERRSLYRKGWIKCSNGCERSELVFPSLYL